MRIRFRKRGGDGPTSGSLTYADAGVDISAGEEGVERIRERVRKTFRPEVIGNIGGFGGLFAFDSRRYRDPVLVATTDGVGTKLMVARMVGRHDTIGRDLVAMCVDDLVCSGAEPLFFLDYISSSPLDPELISQIVDGIVEGCREAQTALIGGEMAEHPGMMNEGEYELAGFSVGVVERDRMITGDRIRPGDAVIGLESGGLRSNGYSLARAVFFDKAGLSVEDRLPGLGHKLGDELLKPSRIYAPALLSLVEHHEVHGIAHVTGGGIPANLARILPPKTDAVIDASRWDPDPIFGVVQEIGGIATEEMFRVFNMGLGMLVVLPEEETFHAIDHLRSRGHHAHKVGEIEKGKRRVEIGGLGEGP